MLVRACHHHSHSSQPELRGLDRKGVKEEDKVGVGDRTGGAGWGFEERWTGVHADSVLRIPRVCVLFQNTSALLTQTNTAPAREDQIERGVRAIHRKKHVCLRNAKTRARFSPRPLTFIQDCHSTGAPPCHDNQNFDRGAGSRGSYSSEKPTTR